MNKEQRKSNNPAGRPLGTPNRVTAKVREVIAQFAEDNAPNLQQWLEEVAETDPKGAVQLYTRLLEYHLPKLSRQEVSGIDGEQLTINLIKYGDGNNT